MSFYNRKTNLNEIMTVIKEVPDQEIKKDLTKFLPLNQRESVKKVKIWLIEKLKKLEEK